MVAAGGWFWKRFKPESEAPQGDAVVLSAAIADSASIKKLAGSIEALVEFLKEEADDNTHRDKRTITVLAEIRDSLEDLRKTLRQRTLV